MNHKWYLALIAIWLAVLIGSNAGCVTVVREGTTATPEETTDLPTINSFAASPTNINQGQRTTLSWEVSGADTITIQPEIGTVGASGSLQLSPSASVAYTLTAANQSGSTTSSVTVTVTAAFAGTPDLVITDIWLTGSALNYKIANIGNADAKPSQSYFYLDNVKQATDWVDSLAAGEEITTSFSNFNWNLPAASGGPAQVSAKFNVKACADAGNDIEESNEDNNCLAKTWGDKFTYDFVTNAHMAKWRSNAGDLTWSMGYTNKTGDVHTLNEKLVMCPPQVSNGWMQGRFADFYSPYFGAPITSREIEVPPNARFTARVGFNEGDVSTDGVRVAFGYVDAAGSVVLFPKMDIYSDGTLRNYEIDLSDLAGKRTEFVLWVEASDSPAGDCVRWVEPRIVQE